MTALPKFLGHPDDLCEQWMAETWEPDDGPIGTGWDREDMQSAYREGRDEARRQLAPKWDALADERDHGIERIAELALERDAARDALEKIRHGLEDGEGQPLSDDEIIAIARKALGLGDAP